MDRFSQQVPAASLQTTMDTLEGRVLLSGNVVASVTGGRLTITGDASSNAIVLDRKGLAKNQVRVSSGRSATSINGAAAPVVFSGVRALRAKMGAGNDNVVTNGIGLARAAAFDGGEGNNAFNLDRTSTGEGLSLVNGSSVTLRRVNVGGSTNIATQPRAAALRINDSTFNAVTLNTGSGGDVVRIEADGAANGATSVFKGPFALTTGGGGDLVRIGLKGQAGNRAVFQNSVALNGGAQRDTLFYAESGSLPNGSVVNFESVNPKAVATINLRSARPFAVLAGAGVSNTGPTIITGNLGTSPTATVTGAPTVNGVIHAANPTAAQAKLDLTTAYNEAKGRAGTPTIVLPGELSGLTLTPGVYKNNSSVKLSSGNFTLDAQGNPDAIFIFQMASTLTAISGTKVILAGGAKASNVFWQVGSSATLGTNSTFKGTILADQSITLTSGAKLEGRALARIGAVVLDSNTVIVPAA